MIDGTNIFVVCPAYSKTGGPELLHQLVYTINSCGGSAQIAYYGIDKQKKDSPCNKEYSKYVQDYCSFEDIPDTNDVIVVYPEIYINLMHYKRNVQTYCWWLSVDNYIRFYSIRNIVSHMRYGLIVNYFKNKLWKFNIKFINRKVELNLVQSYYAFDFLKQRGFDKILFLSDYINEEYFVRENNLEKEDIVLYNPRKGIKYTKKIIEASPDLTWIPIQNMTREQVQHLLSKAKMYVDFGEHPGKDRFPREAAISGCCVITSRNGSAGYKEDVPIPDAYKFNDDEEEIKAIVKLIRSCISDYSTHTADFDEYRKFIKNEKRIFVENVVEIFGLKNNNE